MKEIKAYVWRDIGNGYENYGKVVRVRKDRELTLIDYIIIKSVGEGREKYIGTETGFGLPMDKKSYKFYTEKEMLVRLI